LGKFSKEEICIINKLFNKLYIILDDYFKISFSQLMNNYNSKNK